MIILVVSRLESARRIIASACAVLCLVAVPVTQQRDANQRRVLPSAAVIATLPPNGGADYNRLIFETSPYLLEHAGNPVDWHPWSEAAFDKARREGKLIFLSIGFSSCHWCHVMERESFSNAEVASLLNTYFVSIMVDREERPDIDEVYASAAIASRGGAGWPQSVFMTPDQRPFFTASYIPRQSRPGRIGLLQLLAEMAGIWQSDASQLEQMASELLGKFDGFYASAPGATLGEAVLASAYEGLATQFDAEHGGFRVTPKPAPTHHLSFLLRHWHRSGEPQALDMVEQTLDQMRWGGIYDQLGSGFHRYTTDAAWKVPHFEKMLYDQAMIALTYLEAFQATGRELFAETARDVLRYAVRDLRAPEGAFYAAEDADSEGEEGKFYVWSTDELRSALGDDLATFVTDVYQLEEPGNYPDQATGERTGFNVLFPGQPLAARLAGNDDLAAARGRLAAARTQLLEIRAGRVRPFRDDKILADWNGLMVVALARAGQILDETDYVDAARSTADFVLDRLRLPDGRLQHRYRAGEAGLPAHLEDYAFVVWGLIELWETTFEVEYLRAALALNAQMIADFWDAENGGFFMTAHPGEALLARPKSAYDRATPSGNSVAATNLIRLMHLTGNVELGSRVDALFKAFSPQVERRAGLFTHLMQAVDMTVGPMYEVVIAGRLEAADTQVMLSALRKEFVPNKVVVFRPDGEAPPITRLAEYTAAQTSRDGKATAYVCLNYACRLPTTDVDEMLASLRTEP